jgi:polyisoprenoid-binding protein YceI
MRQYNQSSAVCQVFTYKDGILSPFAHDLRIAVTSFVITLGDENRSINARFDADSLRVDCAMVNGAERPDLLSKSEKEEINRIITRDVLQTHAHKDIILKSSSVTPENSTYLVEGALTLHGITRDITFKITPIAGKYVTDVQLRLPDFGIKPFSALFGAVKIRPGILIRVMIPLAGD